MKIHLVVLLSTVLSALCHYPLPADWKPNDYNVWTKDGEAMAVGYPGTGLTCGFGKVNFNDMIPLYKDGFVIAASQDVYNGFHTQDDFSVDCSKNFDTQQENQRYPQCGSTCGVCFEVQGVNGTAIYVNQEIADIKAVNDTGRGQVLNIGWGARAGSVYKPNQKVMKGNGVQPIKYRKIKCPTAGYPIQLAIIEYNYQQTWDNAIEIFPANFAVQIATVEVRGGLGAKDATQVGQKGPWHGMPRAWTNKFTWTGYNNLKHPWQKGAIHQNSNTQDFDVRITSIFNEVVICYGVKLVGVQQFSTACLDESGKGVNFLRDSTNSNVYSAGVDIFKAQEVVEVQSLSLL